MKKTCIKCKEEKDITEFYIRIRNGKEYRRGECKKCKAKFDKKYYKNNSMRASEWRKEYKETEKGKRTILHNTLKRFYGITIDDYERMLYEQDNRCKVCKIHKDDLKKRLAVDHCHKTGKIRGLLCDGCNNGLGCFKDNPKLMEEAIKYLMESNNERD